jgi:hypothetical protein
MDCVAVAKGKEMLTGKRVSIKREKKEELDEAGAKSSYDKGSQKLSMAGKINSQVVWM